MLRPISHGRIPYADIATQCQEVSTSAAHLQDGGILTTSTSV